MQIFISYSRRDQEFVRRLAQALAGAGFDVWMDIEDIEVGSKWSTAIQRGLDTSDLMLVVLSPASMASSNVEDEFTYYLDHKKPIIPVMYEPAKLHFQLGRLQYIDFNNQPFDTALSALTNEIEKRRPQDVKTDSETPGVIKTGTFPAIPAGDLDKIAPASASEPLMKSADLTSSDASADNRPAGRTGEGTVRPTMESGVRRPRRTDDPTAEVEDVYDPDYLPTTPPPVEYAFHTQQSQVTASPAIPTGADEAYHMPLGHSVGGEVPPMSGPPVNRNALMFSAIVIVTAVIAIAIAVLSVVGNSINPPTTNDGIHDPNVQAADYRDSGDGQLAIKQPSGWNFELQGNRDFHIYNDSWFAGRFAPETRVPEGAIDVRLTSHEKGGRQLSSDDLRQIAYETINGTLTALSQRYQIDPSDVNAVTVNGNPAYYARGQLDSAEYMMLLIDYQATDWVEFVIVNTGPDTFNDNQTIISDLVESITLRG